MITRFAPSPTGKLHLGHAYSALLAYEAAREADGDFLVRFEDIDHTRVRQEFYEEILDDLAWLGLRWDEVPWKQSERLRTYEAALTQLKKLGVIYPCYCTRREIEQELGQMAGAPHDSEKSEGPLYPGTCRERTTPLTGRDAAWRLDSAKVARLTGPLDFHDRSRGVIPVQAGLLGDVILARRDIGTSYHLAVVVDDAAQGITHVTRGVDLLSSTHLHRALQTLLDLPQPSYHHHALIYDDSGKRLAKRHDSLALATLRKDGLSRAGLDKMLATMIKK